MSVWSLGVSWTHVSVSSNFENTPGTLPDNPGWILDQHIKFKNMSHVSNEAKLAFYATAYNSGFHKSEGEIQSMYNKKLFPAKTKEPFNYAEIAKWFYNEIKG